jgi:tRNA A37 methylthiotransferase MiaB
MLSEPHHAVLLSTTLLSSKQQVRQAVSAIREHAPESRIICGGVLVDRSFQIKEIHHKKDPDLYGPCTADYFFLEEPVEDACGIDLFVINDPGFETTAPVLAAFQRGEQTDNIVGRIPNLAFHNGRAWEFSGTFIEKSPILPSIDWSIFRKDEIRQAVPMVYSKGCPNRCQFCNFQSLSKYQAKTTEVLAGEVNALLTHHDHPGHIVFCDDNICGNRHTLQMLATFLRDQRYPFKWNSFFDARYIDEALAEKLKQSGCHLLKIGMESADNTILRNMKKPCRTEHYVRAVRALTNHSISIDAYFIVGFPGETQETVKNTVDTINAFAVPVGSVNQFMFFPFVLAPLAPVYERRKREKYGLSGHMMDWSHKTMDSQAALSLIPDVVAKIETMQPQHGNIEKMLVENKKILSMLDKARGTLIRQRLKTGTEDSGLWQLLERLVRQLKPVPAGVPGIVRFE